MKRLSVITSHSMTRLADALSRQLIDSPAGVLAQETIVVLNHGMARWISMELAHRQGVAAGLAFRFPNEVLDDCFRALVPDLPAASPFTREAMTWRIAACLPGLLADPQFAAVAGYLGDNGDDRRLIQVSRMLADLFDQYIIFRPEMILNWDRGRDQEWQPTLWRRISEGFEGQHRAALLDRLRRNTRLGTSPAAPLPSRISLFGISYLPPFHVEAFALLAERIEVSYYLQNPCGGYWGDIVSRQRLADLLVRDTADANEYYDTGNPLLSSLGTMGQEFHDLLLERGFDTLDLDNGTESTAGGSLLHALQLDIRQLRDSGGRDQTIEVRGDDRTLQIHACHGPLREMEVLYDNLLAMFEELDHLEPRQIAVMIPDIEAYAPYIAAVFGVATNDRPPIPFTIADRSQRSENPAIDLFFRILALPSSRFGITEMMAMLESPPVMEQFGLDSSELDKIRDWLKETGVAWGYDGEQRAALGFPAYEDFSWQAALKRLLLGYALAPDQDRLFAGLLPCQSNEGRGALALGKLAHFLATAQQACSALSHRCTPAAWADCLVTVIHSLIGTDQNKNNLTPIFTAIETLRRVEESAGIKILLSLQAVQECLKGMLETSVAGYGFLGGQVTFCAMLPMRSIPFRVVWLAGMDDGLFPRSARPPAFSLMAGQRRRGDRSLRDEDRYLFLEALMAAGERLCISYTGQSDRDNTVLPPSVVVAELQDYIGRAFRVSGSLEPPDILVRHRLQPFSADYFGSDPRLFTFSSQYRDALQARLHMGCPPRRFIEAPLPDDPALLQRVDIDDLRRFLSNPSAAFLTKRMGVRPRRPTEELDEREPFALDGRAGFELRQELVRQKLDGGEPTAYYATARAKGILPALSAGVSIFAKVTAQSVEFAERLKPLIGAALEPLPVLFSHDGMTLCGTLSGLRAERLVHWRCASLRASDRLSLWLDHLLLCCLAPPGYPRESLLVCRDAHMHLAPTDNATTLLADLLELYREGLRSPLPFFPQSSWLYLTEGRDRAETRWNGSDRSPGPAEGSDPAYTLCFGHAFPADAQLAQLAQRVYGPVLAVATEEKVRDGMPEQHAPKSGTAPSET